MDTGHVARGNIGVMQISLSEAFEHSSRNFAIELVIKNRVRFEAFTQFSNLY